MGPAASLAESVKGLRRTTGGAVRPCFRAASLLCLVNQRLPPSPTLTVACCGTSLPSASPSSRPLSWSWSDGVFLFLFFFGFHTSAQSLQMNRPKSLRTIWTPLTLGGVIVVGGLALAFDLDRDLLAAAAAAASIILRRRIPCWTQSAPRSQATPLRMRRSRSREGAWIASLLRRWTMRLRLSRADPPDVTALYTTCFVVTNCDSDLDVRHATRYRARESRYEKIWSMMRPCARSERLSGLSA
mmetsp:Transcript_12594/g.29867  ORF Transcript_12594/g.29867 Transcript_12594/m.29867 type:complete len:243 (-) Transcript_12594:195-923(-)